jgi:outer membrane murein-binding lipoprotein Lpp
MKKPMLFKIIITIIISAIFIAGCQSFTQNNQAKSEELSYDVNNIILNNKIGGITIEIYEAKILKFSDPDNLKFSYIITNNSNKAISRGAYMFVIRGYSKEGFLLFECEEEYILNAEKLDFGKKDDMTSWKDIYPGEDIVVEIVIDFDRNPMWQ